MSSADEASLKRLAINLAAQLPEDRTDAIRALEFTRDIVVGFLHRHKERTPLVSGIIVPMPCVRLDVAG